MKVVLSIAGSDCSGGAGMQADLKTMCAHRVYGMTAITALTVQNTLGVRSVSPVTPSFLEEQLDACLSDIGADAIKIGMIPKEALLLSVIRKLKEYNCKNIVLDPVMISTSGKRLMDAETVKKMEKELFPLCRLITPNLPEVEYLSGEKAKDYCDMEMMAEKLGKKYGCAILIKGGHFKENGKNGADSGMDEIGENSVTDVLFEKGHIYEFSEKRIENPNTHGTGCTLSSAIASNLALGYSLEEAVMRGKQYVTKVIEQGLELGHGVGPMNHMI